MTAWMLSSSSDPRALAVVDGLGKFRRFGPHYSRRTPGSRTFTGIGQEIVLVTTNGRAVWACVRQKTPQRRGSGESRGRSGATDCAATFVFRNNVFCSRYAGVASELIREATARTYEEWAKRYGAPPPERLRTEVDVLRVRSREPGRCYLLAGWTLGPLRRGKQLLYAPERASA